MLGKISWGNERLVKNYEENFTIQKFTYNSG